MVCVSPRLFLMLFPLKLQQQNPKRKYGVPPPPSAKHHANSFSILPNLKLTYGRQETSCPSGLLKKQKLSWCLQFSRRRHLAATQSACLSSAPFRCKFSLHSVHSGRRPPQQ